MRHLLAIALCVALVAVGFGIGVTWQRQRDTATAASVAVTAPPASALPTAPVRSFTASNGVTLTGDDLRQAEVNARAVDKMVAQSEYRLKMNELRQQHRSAP